MISSMKYVYAESCRIQRHSEDLKGLLKSRGRVMAQQLNAQLFGWATAYPQEVPSTA
jgi:hypothetical protein